MKNTLQNSSMEPSTISPQETINVLMFPWLAHGHISPYLELAKKLTTRNFIIHLCSTPANLSSIKGKIGKKFENSIQVVEFHLPALPDLPPMYHTTNGLPPHLMPTLKQAFNMAIPNFSCILTALKPDLLIYDFLQPWAPVLASGLKIPAVEFITSSSTMTSYMFHYFMKPKVEFPFETIFYRDYEFVHRANLLSTCEKVKKDAFNGVNRSCQIVLIKGFKEIEEKYSDYLSTLLGKKIVPVGALVQNPSPNNDSCDGTEIMMWLDKKGKNSTIFVSFGSEYFLKQEDLVELASGLELISNVVNFIWVLRFPKGEKVKIEDVLPKDYLDRVKGRGLVMEGWAPQAKILGHPSIGGFVSHCGCSSLMESMKFGVPIIAMPMHLDQPLNARLVEEIGVGMEVVRNKFGKLDKEEIAAVIRGVVVDEGGGGVRKKAKEMSLVIRDKGDEEIDEVVREIVKLCFGDVKELLKGLEVGNIPSNGVVNNKKKNNVFYKLLSQFCVV